MSKMIDYLLLRHSESINFEPKYTSAFKISFYGRLKKKLIEMLLVFKSRSFIKNLEKFIVLTAWIVIYVAFYFASKGSLATYTMKAHSVNRMGLPPPMKSGFENINSLKPDGGKNER